MAYGLLRGDSGLWWRMALGAPARPNKKEDVYALQEKSDLIDLDFGLFFIFAFSFQIL
jgi:hypothetical protein